LVRRDLDHHFVADPAQMKAVDIVHDPITGEFARNVKKNLPLRV